MNRHNTVAPLNDKDKTFLKKDHPDNEKDNELQEDNDPLNKDIENEDIKVKEPGEQLIADIEAEREKILALEQEHKDQVEEMINY